MQLTTCSFEVQCRSCKLRQKYNGSNRCVACGQSVGDIEVVKAQTTLPTPEVKRRQTVSCYARYLQSDWWKRKRNQKMRSVKGKCEECGSKAGQVHHLHYRSLNKEKNKDLQALCGKCHEHKHIAIKEMAQHFNAI